ncbi:universal stress protein [Nonomuraea sediminis]|uniref:universal stress protein n=1 Tax=Nonomuraea sediminis TaxID=2835864 RepID=UPI001BDBBECE|nr:universal stress protein [Nonomuraea sediminis]
MNEQIVVAVDGSEASQAAVDWAATDARRRGRTLKVVHVCEQVATAETEYCEKALAAAVDRARVILPESEIASALMPGHPVETLVAESARADSIVLGSRGLGGFAGLVVGSVSLLVAGHATGPVVVVRGTDPVEHGEVVLGFDGSRPAQAAAEYAFEQARARGARLRAVYAWQAPPASPYAVGYGGYVASVFKTETAAMREALTPWREKYQDIQVIDDEVCDHPVSALIKASRTADLVVVGSRGLGGFASAVLGSVSHGVLHHVEGPVAVVRPRKG